jgi:hypothetical protein
MGLGAGVVSEGNKNVLLLLGSFDCSANSLALLPIRDCGSYGARLHLHEV